MCCFHSQPVNLCCFYNQLINLCCFYSQLINLCWFHSQSINLCCFYSQPLSSCPGVLGVEVHHRGPLPMEKVLLSAEMEAIQGSRAQASHQSHDRRQHHGTLNVITSLCFSFNLVLWCRERVLVLCSALIQSSCCCQIALSFSLY